MKRGDDLSGTSVVGSCPFSRLPVEMRPEWTDVLLDGDHRFNLKLIGQQIVCSRPTGFVDEPTTLETLVRIEEAVRTSFPEDLPFIWISDYTDMSGITIGARKLFASTVSGWTRLRGMVLFGMSPFFSAIVRLGIRLKLVPFPIHTVQSYPEAIELATSMLKTISSHERPNSVAPVILTDDRWRLELEGYSIRFEVIDGSILHSVQKGRIREEHLDAVFALREEVMRSSGLKNKPFSILAGLRDVEKSDNSARLGYIRRMSRWYQENPFDVEVFYGMNSLMRTVIRVSATLAPFKVHVSKTYDEGLKFIERLVSAKQGRTSSGSLEPPATGQPNKGVPREKIDDLLKVVGAISWDTDEALKLEAVDPADPLALVYQAIGLIKIEIDELLARQQRDAEERRQLQDRLAMAEKMEAVVLLAGGVAHDLNNILSGIVSYPELLLMDGSLSPEARLRIEAVKRSGDQAAAVVKDLMAVSRGVATRTEPVSLGAVVKEYLCSPDFEVMSSRCPGIVVESRLEEESALVSGAAVHLRTVVANLVANAFESFEPECVEGRVGVETFHRTVAAGRTAGPTGAPDCDTVVLRVVDNGPGIAPEHRDRIFEPFFTKKIVGRSGTGLGLTVVWNTVRNHGGFIDVVTGPEGTSFDLYFPVTSEPLPEANENLPLEHLRGSGQRILVVDDVSMQREIATDLLVQLGYTAESVPSGEAAIERLRLEDFDCLLLDMLMEPGLNGRETYARILEFRPDQKVVIASGYSQDDEVGRARGLGAAAFLAKPYSLAEVGVAVRDALGMKEIRRMKVKE